MLVDGADEVGSHVDGILGKSVSIILEGEGEILGPLLVRVQQQLDPVDSMITPADLTTPLELRRVILVVKDQRRNLGLTVAFEA